MQRNYIEHVQCCVFYSAFPLTYLNNVASGRHLYKYLGMGGDRRPLVPHEYPRAPTYSGLVRTGASPPSCLERRSELFRFSALC